MRQVQIDEFGPPEVLHLVQVPDRLPGPGQVLVRTAAAGITFVETQVRAGRPPWPGGGPALPAVLGNGVAGQIVAVGDGVYTAWLGRRVVTATGGSGGYADQVVVAAADPIGIPDSLEPGQALALLADGRTAYALVRAAHLSPADRVLVTAAAGGVGSLLLQLARGAGVKQVIAAAGGERKLALARQLGADLAVDYTLAGWTDAVPGAVDVLFDGVGGQLGQDALTLIAAGGRLLRYGAASGAFTDVTDIADQGVTLIPGNTLIRSPEDNRQLIQHAIVDTTASRLRPVVGQTFPLSNAAAAHAAIEARATVGKTILIPA